MTKAQKVSNIVKPEYCRYYALNINFEMRKIIEYVFKW